MPAGPNMSGFDTLSFGPIPGYEEWKEYDQNGRFYKRRWLYNACGAALAAGDVVVVNYDGDEETNPQVGVCAALAVYQEVAVFKETASGGTSLADATWGWFVVQGYVDAKCNGDSVDITKDDFLKIVAGTDADAFVDNTTARTTNSHAIACADETDATPSVTLVYLFGRSAIIT